MLIKYYSSEFISVIYLGQVCWVCAQGQRHTFKKKLVCWDEEVAPLSHR